MTTSVREWVAGRVWRLRKMVADRWGDDAGAMLESALHDYVNGERDAERMRCEIRDLRERLRRYEHEPATVVNPGPTWTGD